MRIAIAIVRNSVYSQGIPMHLMPLRYHLYRPDMKTLDDRSLTVEEKLLRIRTDAVKEGVLEGFAEIERGEVVKLTRDDLRREASRCRKSHTRHN